MEYNKNDYFGNALSNFTFSVAAGSSICHMADKGYTVKYIKEHLGYPVSFEKVQETVWRHLSEQKVILMDEPGTGYPEDKIVYVKDYGKYGRTSLRGITVPGKDYKDIMWHTQNYRKDNGCPFGRYISGKCFKNGEETSYISCNFGVLKKKEPESFAKILSVLDSRKREYIEGLPWTGRCVFHRLNSRMQEIAAMLYEKGLYEGCCYFIELKEKIIFR